MVDVDGGGGNDSYTVQMSGVTHRPVGSPPAPTTSSTSTTRAATDFNTLTINGVADAQQHLPAAPGLRRPAAPGSASTATASFGPDYERINYDRPINVLHVNGGTLADQFYVDDNSAITVLDGVAGNDTFQFGQIFGDDARPPRPTWRRATRSPPCETTVGYLSRGISYATTAYGGTGNDTFTVYSNKADLKLFGEGGNNTFIVRAFLHRRQPTGSATRNTRSRRHRHQPHRVQHQRPGQDRRRHRATTPAW